jgi:hypothetical protein
MVVQAVAILCDTSVAREQRRREVIRLAESKNGFRTASSQRKYPTNLYASAAKE